MSAVWLRAAALITLSGTIVAAQDNPEPLLQKAIELHRAGDAEKAIPQYRAYLKARPENVDARSNLAWES